MLDLYCYPCSGNHSFSFEDAERLVYVLNASLADANVRAAVDNNDDWPSLACLDDLVFMADDDEYAEHVNGSVGHRKLHALFGADR